MSAITHHLRCMLNRNRSGIGNPRLFRFYCGTKLLLEVPVTPPCRGLVGVLARVMWLCKRARKRACVRARVWLWVRVGGCEEAMPWL